MSLRDSPTNTRKLTHLQPPQLCVPLKCGIWCLAQGALRAQAEETHIECARGLPPVNNRGRSVSKDGKTLTATNKMPGAKGMTSVDIAVFDKQ